jgi:hypothetical protein
MPARRSIVRAAGGLLIVTLMFACSVFRSNPPAAHPASVSLPTVTPTPQASPTPVPHHHRHHKRKNRVGAPSPAEATPEPSQSPSGSPGATPEPGPAASPSPVATPTPLTRGTAASAAPIPASPSRVSIGGENADPSQVTGLIGETRGNLGKADRQRLKGDDAAAYDQASNLLAASRQALKQGDYLEAYGLAQKAKVISDRFANTPSP